MAASTLDDRVSEATEEVFGLIAAFLHARSTLGDVKVTAFLDKVPEEGEALWLRFRAAQRKDGGDSFDFNAFITSVLS